MKNNKNKSIWRRLDNSAKIFPMSTGQKYSTVFRLSAVLKEELKEHRISHSTIEIEEQGYECDETECTVDEPHRHEHGHHHHHHH